MIVRLNLLKYNLIWFLGPITLYNYVKPTKQLQWLTIDFHCL